MKIMGGDSHVWGDGDGDSLASPLRTSNDIKTTLENAKLESRDLQGHLSQVISFATDFSEGDLRLLELNDDILGSINVGSRLVIRGGMDDFPVLCTENSTYEVKEADTSNSLLVMNSLSFPESPTKKTSAASDLGTDSIDLEKSGEEEEEMTVSNRSILRVIHSYFEVKKINPNLACLHKILLPSAYAGQAEDSRALEYEAEPLTFEMLLERVPASQQQIRDYLERKMRCVELNGKVRVVAADYLLTAVNDVLMCIDENRWPNDRIPTEEIVTLLSFEYSEIILRSIIKWFFTEAEADSTSGEGLRQIRKMNEYEICRFLGGALLRTVNKTHCLKDFLSAWQECVPKGLKVNLKQLDGLALCDRDCTPSVIRHFPEENLPDSITERFMMLFVEKSKWREEEITPYVQGYVTPTQNASTLLTKHARVQTNGTVKFYVSRHATK